MLTGGAVRRRVLPLDGAQPGRGAARRRARAARRGLAGRAAAPRACGPTRCRSPRRTASRWSAWTTRPTPSWRRGPRSPATPRRPRPADRGASRPIPPRRDAWRGYCGRSPVRRGVRVGRGVAGDLRRDRCSTPGCCDVALDEARAGLAEGGIPIGAALFAADGTLLGRGHNRRVQDGDPSMHAETAAFRAAGRQRDYRTTIMVTTLSPCWYCSGLVRQFGIGAVRGRGGAHVPRRARLAGRARRRRSPCWTTSAASR